MEARMVKFDGIIMTHTVAGILVRVRLTDSIIPSKTLIHTNYNNKELKKHGKSIIILLSL